MKTEGTLCTVLLMWILGQPVSAFAQNELAQNEEPEQPFPSTVVRVNGGGSAGAILYKGLWEAWNGQLDAALKDLNLAIERGADKAKALAGRGWVYLAKEEYEKALTDFSESLRIEPEQAWVLQQRARTYYASGKTKFAMIDLERAARLDKSPALILRNIAFLLAMDGEFDKAVEKCNQAMAASPDDEWKNWLLSIRGTVNLAAGHAKYALADFKENLEYDPSDSYALGHSCLAYLALDQSDTAMKMLQEAEKKHPGKPEIAFVRGAYHARMGRTKDAIEALSLALNQTNQPTSDTAMGDRGAGTDSSKPTLYALPFEIRPLWKVSALGTRAQEYAKSNDFPKALSDLREIIRLVPSYAKAYSLRGAVEAKLGRFEEAKKDFDHAIRLNPKDGRSLRGRAWLHGREEHWELAVADLTEAIRLQPRNGEIYEARAGAYGRLGKQELAIADADMALCLEPNNSRNYWVRAAAYERLGDSQRALEDYMAAIRLDPSNQELRRCGGILLFAMNRYSDALEQLNLYQGHGGSNAYALSIRDWIKQNLAKQISSSVTVYPVFENLASAQQRLEQSTKTVRESLQLASAQTEDAKAKTDASRAKAGDSETIESYTKFLESHPTDASAHRARGTIYAQLEEWKKARDDFSAALQNSPKDPELLSRRAEAYGHLKHFSKAVADCEAALEVYTEKADTCNQLAWLLASSPDVKVRDGKRAVTLATKACQSSHWGNGAYLETLAAAYAECGSFAQAVELEQKSIQMLCPPQMKEASARLELYKKQKPFRQDP